MRILIAEDDQVLADGLLRALRASGYAVDRVSSGTEADTALATHEFDLVILDLGLPRLHGLEVLRKLRARGSTMPVLILTAADSVEQRVTGLDLGADDYMAKPFHMPELAARVRAEIIQLQLKLKEAPFKVLLILAGPDGSGRGELLHTLKHMRQYPNTLKFLIAYLLYNDAIQTVIAMAGQFGSDELKMPMEQLTLAILMVQFVAFAGALLLLLIPCTLAAPSLPPLAQPVGSLRQAVIGPLREFLARTGGRRADPVGGRREARHADQLRHLERAVHPFALELAVGRELDDVAVELRGRGGDLAPEHLGSDR